MSSLYKNALELEFDNARCRGINLVTILSQWQQRKITGKLKHADWPRDMRDFMRLKVLQGFIRDAKQWDAHLMTDGHIHLRTDRGRLLITYDAKL